MVLSDTRKNSPRRNGPVLSPLHLGTACVVTMFAVGAVFMNQAIFMDIASFFHLDAQEARFSFSVISFCYSITFLWAGPLADSFDCGKIAAAGLGAMAVLLLGAAWLREYAWFLVCMGLAGAAAAVVPASMFPHVSRLAPPHRNAVFVGSVVAAATLGIVVGRASLGAVTDSLGWRASYRVFALFFALLACITLYVLRSPEKVGKTTRDMRKPYAEMVRMLVAPATASLLLTGFFLFFGFLGAVTFLTYRLVAPPFSFTSAQIGYISFAGIAAVIAPFSGGLSRRFGAYGIILAGLAVCLAALQFLYWSHGVVFMALGILLLFLGAYACQPLLFLLIGRRTPPESMGCASSLYILFCIGGGSLSSIVLGNVWEKYGWPGIIVACSGSILLALGMAIAIMMGSRRE